MYVAEVMAVPCQQRLEQTQVHEHLASNGQAPIASPMILNCLALI